MTSIVESTLPGVTAIINAGQVASPIAQQPTSTAFVVGYSPWGPVNVPTTVTSWPDFVRQFGGFDANSYLDDFLYTFFNLFPGKQAVVVRVVGAGKTLGTLTLKDGAAGAGLNTVRVDAKYPSLRADILVTIAAGTNANTFKLTARSGFVEGGRTEIWDNLTIADAATIAKVDQDSKLVNLTDLASATPPGNTGANNPRVLAETALAAGSDDYAGLAVADYIGVAGPPKTGLQCFNDEVLGGGQVAIPGIGTTEPAHAALIAHAAAYHRLALLDPPLASSKSDVATSRALYGSWYGAMYWPWVQCQAFDGSNLLKFYPPSGFAAGACAQVDRTIGFHKAPANIPILAAVDVERLSGGQAQVDDGVREYLNGKDVNVIAPLPGQGIKIYGARVMTGDRRVSFVHEIRVLNECYYAGKLGYQWAVFQVVDGTGRLFRDLRAVGEAFLRSLYQAGALFGKTEKQAFVVVADDSNNPPNELSQGRVHVQWGIRISPTAEIIILNIDNVSLIQDLSVLQ
jgi:Bacteriophage tail sheath protein